MKLAIFDFDDTIIRGQSPDLFCEYILNNINKNNFQKIIHYLNKKKLIPKYFKIKKKLLLYSLKGTSKKEIKNYSNKFYSTLIFNKKILNEINKYIKNKYKIVVISGGYAEYIRFFKKSNHVIANELKYRDNIFTGHIRSKDCMGRQKVFRILKEYSVRDVNSSVFYSDSYSDLPLFKLVKKPYLYKNKKINLINFD